MTNNQIRITKCKSCGQPIHFIESKNGRYIPVNDKKLSVVTVMGDVVSGWEAHFSNCPGASQFRKKKVDGKK